MNRFILLLCAAAAFLAAPAISLAQTSFGDRVQELKDVSTVELVKPDIPDNQVGDPPQPGPVPRPLYLVYRYYSCVPWYPFHVRNVFTSVVPREQYVVEIDTAGANQPGDNVQGQLVTDINHAAYGLYCIQIRVCVPWAAWQPGIYHRWYIRWAYNAPYWCWIDHWWYYWQRPSGCVTVTMDAAQEIQTPAVESGGTGTAQVCILADGSITYTGSFSGLRPENTGTTAAHFHGPATSSQNANVIQGITIPLNVRNGTFTGTVAPGQNPPLMNALLSGQTYINIHSGLYPGGEIRGQVPAITPPGGPSIWCPWGPTWIPCHRWTRMADIWGLTVCHPYCYPWHPGYIPRPFCLYGLRSYFTPIGNVRQPAQSETHPNAVPLQSKLTLANLAERPWVFYNSVTLVPPYRYWPFTPYCARWYWYRCLPFHLYRYNPPVVQYGIWVNPNNQPINNDFPDMPMQQLPGTVATAMTRGVVSQAGDLTGDGFVNPADQAAYRAENGTRGIDSFFDVFVDIE